MEHQTEFSPHKNNLKSPKSDASFLSVSTQEEPSDCEIRQQYPPFNFNSYYLKATFPEAENKKPLTNLDDDQIDETFEKYPLIDLEMKQNLQTSTKVHSSTSCTLELPLLPYR